MKKALFILFLLLFNILLVYSKVLSKNDIFLDLDHDELAIVIIDNNNSKSLLLLKNDIAIAYILDYNNDLSLRKSLYKFTSNLDYVFTNDSYDIDIANAKIINSKIIEKILLDKNKVSYNNYVFCIDEEKDCDFVYLVNNKILTGENVKAIIHGNNISPAIENDWIDKYIVGIDNYLIIFIKDNYEITNLER